jgi:hypothetical protein
MHTFWIHDPFTIQAFHFTYMFIKIPFSSQNLFPLFNYGDKYIIVETNPTPLKMGLVHGIFMTQSPKTCG